MQKTLWASLLLWIWLAMSCSQSTASAAGAQFTVDVLDWRKGLPQSVVLTVTQTRDGYLWVGTLEGLARFDGLSFTTFDEGNTPGLNSSQIVRLFEDSRTNLWIGTESAGVFVASTGQVSRVHLGPATSEGRLASISEDSAGAVWLYTSEGRLARYQRGKVDSWDVHPGRESNCRAMVADGSSYLWVGTDRILFGLQTASEVKPGELPLGISIPMLKLDFLVPSRDGTYWRLADRRIQKFRGTVPESGPVAYPWTTNAVTAACEDRDGNLVVGTYGDGVYWFNNQGGYDHISDQLSNKSVLSLLVDREGCLWVGTNGGGLNRVKRRIFEVLQDSEGLTVQTVCEDSQGGLWIGYNSERVDYLAKGELKQYNTLLDRTGMLFSPTLYVKSLFIDSRKQLWAGVLNGGLWQFRDGRFSPAPGTERLPRNVSVIFENRAKRLCLGTSDGLAVQSESGWLLGTNTGLPSAAGSLDGPVRAIVDDREGGLWIGTEGTGLYCLRGDQVQHFSRTNGLPSNNVRSLLCDKDGVLWAGTSSGLARHSQGSWVSYAGRLGHSRGGVGYLLEDGLGYLWMGTTAGLLRASKADLNAAAATGDTVMVRSFGEPDGLPSGECSQGSQPAACRSENGKLWFPTIKGLVSVDPAKIIANTNPPPVIIESVLVDGRPQYSGALRSPILSAITIPAGRESLEIQYTSLNFSAPDKGLFKYTMHRHETFWTERPGEIRSARYSRLPPGEYRFQVTASNEDGYWNKTGASLVVIVLPPFWQTWWFITISTVFLLGLIIGSVSYVSTQRLQRQLAALRQKEAVEKERARIARDLHDQLGANLTQVALLGEMAEADKNQPDEVESHARQISQTARDTTHALDEIVWTVNPSNDTLEGLVNYVCKYAQDYLALAGLKYRLEVPPQLPATPISPELRHNVFLAAKEAINNIVKHAKASSAHIRLSFQSDRFLLEIEDNGQGVSAANATKGRNGLRNMRKRMEDVGGSFELSPGPGGGTRVILAAPLPHPGNPRNPV